MNKKDFNYCFKMLVNKLYDNKVQSKLYEIAEKFNRSVSTVEKWYDGKSAPNEIMRNSVMEYLENERKRKDAMDIVRDVIRNELTIEVRHDCYTPMYEGDPPSFEICLKLDGEIIYKEYATLQWW